MAEPEDGGVKFERGGVEVQCRACLYCSHFNPEECAVIVEQTSPVRREVILMDPDTLLIIAAIPFYTISTVVVAKYAWMTFQSQAQEQTTETATVPGK